MRVVALVADLMDRSRLSAAVPDVEFVRDVSETTGSDVVILDLARHADAVAAISRVAPGARIVAYGPHVDDVLLTRARSEGATVVLPRSRFFRDPAAALAAPDGTVEA